MDIRPKIVQRYTIFYLLGMAFLVTVVVKIILIQGDEIWEEKGKRLEVKKVTLAARRGDICASDGRPLATSVPYYTIRMDLKAPGVKAVFNQQVDSLSMALSGFFKDKSAKAYEKSLRAAYARGNRYFLINKRKVSFLELQEIERFPIFRRGRNRGGVISEHENLRVYPFGNVASRTLGKVNTTAYGGIHGAIGDYGLECSFEAELKGHDGRAIKQNLSGRWLNVSKEEPQDGYDLITTLDVDFQDMVMHALEDAMVKFDAEFGTAVLMEVETGDLKAIANFGRDSKGVLRQGYHNYALGSAGCAEPGSTFKLVSLMVALEDGKVDTSTVFSTGNGVYKYKDRVVRDSDWRHGGHGDLTVKEIFELSSNVGVVKAITENYEQNPAAFIERVYSFGLNQKLGMGLKGEGAPYIKHPSTDPSWSGVSLAWMSYGYELKMTPLQTLTFYNAIANNGRMVKPRLVKAVSENGRVRKEYGVSVINQKICSSETLGKAQAMLEGVVERGTGRSLKTENYKIAGKTGTAQVANRSKGYNYNGRKVYQASFVGYFPAGKPRYSCIVVVNGPKGSYYGGSVAGPVFRAISDNVYAHDLRIHDDLDVSDFKAMEEFPATVAGKCSDLEEVLDELDLLDGRVRVDKEWAQTIRHDDGVNLEARKVTKGLVPNVKGMGAADAIFLLENSGLAVRLSGKGKVVSQSLKAGQRIRKGQTIFLRLS